MAWSIRNREGKFLGEMPIGSGWRWLPIQFAGCYDNEQQAGEIAHLMGAEVVKSPKWDAPSKRWTVPS